MPITDFVAKLNADNLRKLAVVCNVLKQLPSAKARALHLTPQLAADEYLLKLFYAAYDHRRVYGITPADIAFLPGTTKRPKGYTSPPITTLLARMAKGKLRGADAARAWAFLLQDLPTDVLDVANRILTQELYHDCWLMPSHFNKILVKLGYDPIPSPSEEILKKRQELEIFVVEMDEKAPGRGPHISMKYGGQYLGMIILDRGDGYYALMKMLKDAGAKLTPAVLEGSQYIKKEGEVRDAFLFDIT